MIRSLLASALTALSICPAVAETVTLLDKPIHVTQTVGDFDPNGMAATTLVGDGPGQRRIETFIGAEIPFADRDQALAVGRAQVKWQPPYLLVESVNNWKQAIYNPVWVFKLVDGRPERLGLLGGGSLESPGRFLSLYNKAPVWESLGFACTACKSNLRIVLHDDGGRLIPDGEATWLANQQIWRANEESIRSGLATGEPSGDEDTVFLWRQEVERALIENAALAAYCGHDGEVRRLEALVQKNLDPDSRKDFEKSLRNVTALEPPEHWAAVWQGP